MTNKLTNLLFLPRVGLLLLLASAASLTFAFIMQFVFGVEPCILCLAQRVPFAVATILAATLVAARPFGKHSTALLFAIAFVYFVNTVIAIFHTGVEQHWWLGTSGCSTQPLAGNNPDELREALLKTTLARCDEISWTFLGLSMANWNILLSGGLAAFAALGAKRQHDQNKGVWHALISLFL